MRSFIALIPFAAAALLSAGAQAQMFVTNYGSGTVGKYDAATGAAIDPSFITGLGHPTDMVIDANQHLFVSSWAGVREYDAISGALLNPAFITQNAISMTLDRHGHLFVGSYNGLISRYDASTGQVINDSYISSAHPFGLAADDSGHLFASTGSVLEIQQFDAENGARLNDRFVAQIALGDPAGIALDGKGHLFVANNSPSHISEYDAVTGATINANLFYVKSAWGIAVADDGDVFATSGDTLSDGNVYRYDATTGQVTAFITGLNVPQAIAFLPEPSTLALIGICTFALTRTGARTRRSRFGVRAMGQI